MVFLWGSSLQSARREPVSFRLSMQSVGDGCILPRNAKHFRLRYDLGVYPSSRWPLQRRPSIAWVHCKSVHRFSSDPYCGRNFYRNNFDSFCKDSSNTDGLSRYLARITNSHGSGKPDHIFSTKCYRDNRQEQHCPVDKSRFCPPYCYKRA